MLQFMALWTRSLLGTSLLQRGFSSEDGKNLIKEYPWVWISFAA
jgi:hypothetical protein